MNYKSLDSYQYFVKGWVRQILVRPVGNKRIIIGRLVGVLFKKIGLVLVIFESEAINSLHTWTGVIAVHRSTFYVVFPFFLLFRMGHQLQFIAIPFLGSITR